MVERAVTWLYHTHGLVFKLSVDRRTDLLTMKQMPATNVNRCGRGGGEQEPDFWCNRTRTHPPQNERNVLSKMRTYQKFLKAELRWTVAFLYKRERERGKKKRVVRKRTRTTSTNHPASLLKQLRHAWSKRGLKRERRLEKRRLLLLYLLLICDLLSSAHQI